MHEVHVPEVGQNKERGSWKVTPCPSLTTAVLGVYVQQTPKMKC